jgi:hypothetical protein
LAAAVSTQYQCRRSPLTKRRKVLAVGPSWRRLSAPHRSSHPFTLHLANFRHRQSEPPPPQAGPDLHLHVKETVTDCRRMRIRPVRNHLGKPEASPKPVTARALTLTQPGKHHGQAASCVRKFSSSTCVGVSKRVSSSSATGYDEGINIQCDETESEMMQTRSYCSRHLIKESKATVVCNIHTNQETKRGDESR